MNLEEARENLGRPVVYRTPGQADEIGMIESASESFVFVRYGGRETAVATSPGHLALLQDAADSGGCTYISMLPLSARAPEVGELVEQIMTIRGLGMAGYGQLIGVLSDWFVDHGIEVLSKGQPHA
jgi:hypothetical protein